MYLTTFFQPLTFKVSFDPGSPQHGNLESLEHEYNTHSL